MKTRLSHGVPLRSFGVIAALMACLLMAGCGGKSSPLGAACVSGVWNVGDGPNASLYIQDSRGIVHYSKSGKVLARFGPDKQDFAVDPHGDVYYLSGADILKVSPSGKVIARWRAPDMYPEAADSKGDVIAAKGGISFTGDGPDRFNLYSPGGSLIAHWVSSYSGQMAFDHQGAIYTTGEIGEVLARLNAKTGAVEVKRHAPLGATFDEVGADPEGNIYLGMTDGHETPFAVVRLTPRGKKFHLKVLSSSQESVGGLAIDSDGTIFVIRSSYAESSSTNTGLEVLSKTGSSQGRVPACKK